MINLEGFYFLILKCLAVLYTYYKSNISNGDNYQQIMMYCFMMTARAIAINVNDSESMMCRLLLLFALSGHLDSAYDSAYSF